MIWGSRRDSAQIVAVYTRSKRKSYKQSVWNGLKKYWCISTLMKHSKVLKIFGHITDCNVYRIAQVIVDSLLKNFQHHYDLYCRYWFAFFQCLLGATIKKQAICFAQNYQEFHTAIKKTVKLKNSCVSSKVFTLVWHKCWNFIEYKVQAAQNIQQLSTQTANSLQNVIHLESILILCYDAFKQTTSFYYHRLCTRSLLKCFYLHNKYNIFKPTIPIDLKWSLLQLYICYLLSKSFSVLVLHSSFLKFSIRYLLVVPNQYSLSNTTRTKASFLSRSDQNVAKSLSGISKVPRLNLQGLRAPLAAYGILSPGDCRSSHVILPPQYNQKIISNQAVDINEGASSNNQYNASNKNEEQLEMKDPNFVVGSVLFLVGILTKLTSMVIPCTDFVCDVSSTKKCTCLITQLSFIILSLVTCKSRIPLSKLDTLQKNIFLLFGDKGWLYFLCIIQPHNICNRKVTPVEYHPFATGCFSSVFLVKIPDGELGAAKILSLPVIVSKTYTSLMLHYTHDQLYSTCFNTLAKHILSHELFETEENIKQLFRVWFELATHSILKSEKQCITPQLLGLKLQNAFLLEDHNKLKYSQTVKPTLTKEQHFKKLRHKKLLQAKPYEKELWVITEKYDMNLLQWRDTLKAVPVSNTVQTSYVWLTTLLEIYQKILIYVNALHTKLIAHGDLKCQNILVKKSKILQIALTDFGDTVWAEKFSLETFQLVVKYDILECLFCDRNWLPLRRKLCSILNCIDLCGGTNMIHSPERLGFYDSINSLQQDVWALGCLFFQLLTGVFLFDEQAQNVHTTSLSDSFDDCTGFTKMFHYLQKEHSNAVPPLASMCLHQTLKKYFYNEQPLLITKLMDLMTNFLVFCLERDPHKRPTCCQLMSYYESWKKQVVKVLEDCKQT
ncbi:uncharacterized protein LOC128883977 [Hylaeus volcanicus]|uniref:uncharacterized protein LOC128883977 n=1 Tax=Hylaeus volcanicus TaxID=313075 RepID=UPI0023B79E8B|nr:uncharacterized protein LOC128883977 [Hylaeus volcanicus]